MQALKNKFKNFRYFLLLLVIPLLGNSSISPPSITEPDQLAILEIRAFLAPLETTDILYIVKYRIQYDVLPLESASETYIAQLLDGSTQLASTTPFVFNNLGYGDGVLSFYFNESKVADKGIVWEASYTVRIQGNPSSFAIPPSITSAEISFNTCCLLLSLFILRLARELEETAAWVLNSVDLVAISPEGGSVLTIDGENYFGSIISSLRLMIPSIYPSRIVAPDFTQRAFEQSYAESRKNFWLGTEFEDALVNWSATLDIPRMVLSTIILLVFIFFASGFVFKVTNGNSQMAMIPFAILLPLGALIGLTEMVFAGVLAALSLIGIAYVTVLRQA